jgi:hypothetical protein
MITEFVGFSFIRSDQRDDLTAIMAALQGPGAKHRRCRASRSMAVWCRIISRSAVIRFPAGPERDPSAAPTWRIRETERRPILYFESSGPPPLSSMLADGAISVEFPRISCQGTPHSPRWARGRCAAYWRGSLGQDSRLPNRIGVTTRKCFECTTSWTKHERAASWYVRCTLNGGRSGGGRRHVSDVP